ncbi:MAG: hypothetical protein IJQ39_09280 [Thermoguttaceae bacterium]|nr:hypothetical protein [Thermoguttaceae bacterium]
MKLTLRTLLAYIDNLLPAQDAEEFEALLSKNEAANNLCNRIRSVMTRPELGAPDVLDKGSHLDPNVTAEYLDNVLSSEESPEYERLCINSDRQLSEVSACHQILTVVQIEPAEVDPAWREKVYTAPERVAEEESVDLGGEPAEQSAPSGFMASLSGILSGASGILGGGQSLKLNLDRKAAAPPPVEKADPIPVPPAAPAPRQPQTPPEPIAQSAPNTDSAPSAVNPQAALEQYAQMITTPEIQQPEKPRQNILTWLLCLAALAALIILFVVLFLGPKKNGESEIANNENATVTEEPNASDSLTEKATKPSSKDNASEKASTETTPADAASPADSNGDEQTPPDDETTQPADQQQPEDNDNPETPAAETDNSPDSATEEEDDQDSLPEENTKAVIEDPDSPSTDEDNNVSVPDDSLNTDSAPIDPTDTKAPTAEEEENSDNNSLELFEDDAPQTMVELGKFVKRNGVDSQILAYKAKGAETWRRMTENASVRSGDTLLAFPDYRPDIMLDKNARLRLVGPAKMTISPKSTPEEIHITLDYGRLILATSAAFTQKIVIKCANLPTVLEINQPSVQVTFEADVLRPGDDPCTTPASFYGTISLLNGKANVQNKGVLSPVAAPTLIDCQSGTTNPQGSAPEWRQEATAPVTDLEKRLIGEKPIGVTLSEIIDNKTISKELRQTVLVSLSMMGQYSTLVEDFNKEDRFGVWMDEFIVLQASILKSQANAQSVLEELKKRYDNKGERIFEILWKYHNELTAEDMNALISDLRDETLCVRVASYCLLKSRGVNLGTYKPNDLKKSETTLKALENKYKSNSEM